jgi:molybdopterin converting factor small subunit
MIRVHIPTALRSYTEQNSAVDVDGATVADALTALDRRYPGIRFRIITEQDSIRPHIRIFVNEEQRQDLTASLHGADTLYIICALSGG